MAFLADEREDVFDFVFSVEVILREASDVLQLLVVDFGPLFILRESEYRAHKLELVFDVLPRHQRLSAKQNFSENAAQ